MLSDGRFSYGLYEFQMYVLDTLLALFLPSWTLKRDKVFLCHFCCFIKLSYRGRAASICPLPFLTLEIFDPKWRPKNVQLRNTFPRTNLSSDAVPTFDDFRAYITFFLFPYPTHLHGPHHESLKIAPGADFLIFQAHHAISPARFRQACRCVCDPTRYGSRKRICLELPMRSYHQPKCVFSQTHQWNNANKYLQSCEVPENLPSENPLSLFSTGVSKKRQSAPKSTPPSLVNQTLLYEKLPE